MKGSKSQPSELFLCLKHILNQLDDIVTIFTEKNDLQVQHTYLGIGNNIDENIILYEIQKTIYKIKSYSIESIKQGIKDTQDYQNQQKPRPSNNKKGLQNSGEPKQYKPDQMDKYDQHRQPTLPHIQRPLFTLTKVTEFKNICQKNITAWALNGNKFLLGLKNGNLSFGQITMTNNGVFQIKGLQEMNNQHKDRITCCLSIYGNSFATGSIDGQIIIWDIDNHFLKFKTKINAHRDGVRQIINYTQTQLMSCGEDSQIKIWEYKLLLKQIQTIRIPSNSSLYSILPLSQSRDIIIISTYESIICFNLTKNSVEWNLSERNVFNPQGMVELPNGKIVVATYAPPYSICLVDPRTGKILFERHEDFFMPNGSLLFNDALGLLCAFDKYFIQLNSNFQEFGSFELDEGMKGSAGMIFVNPNIVIIPNNFKGLTIYIIEYSSKK